MPYQISSSTPDILNLKKIYKKGISTLDEGIILLNEVRNSYKQAGDEVSEINNNCFSRTDLRSTHLVKSVFCLEEV